MIERTREVGIDVLVIRPAAVDEDDPAWREQIGALETSVTGWTGNDTRVLEFSSDDIAVDEPDLDEAERDGIDLDGSLRQLRQQTRRANP